MSYLPNQLLTSTAIGNISGPLAGMQVFNTSNTGPYIYSTVNNTTILSNTGTQDQNYTSNPVWIPKLMGSFQEVVYWNGSSTSQWTAAGSTTTVGTWFSSGWAGVNPGGTTGDSLTFTCPNNPAVGVYWMEYLAAGNVNTAQWSLTFTGNGGSPVTLRTAFNTLNSNGVVFYLLTDYFTITSAGHSLSFKWTSTSSGTIYIGWIRLILMQ